MIPQLTPVKSSQLQAVAYEAGTLYVQFHPNKKQTAAGEPGSIYSYSGVTEADHKALMGAESLGSAFHAIKSNPLKYPFEKIS